MIWSQMVRKQQRVVDGVVLVTGGTSGIGAGVAARLHARSAHVIITGRDLARLDSVTARHYGMSSVVMDVTDPDSRSPRRGRGGRHDPAPHHPH